MGSPVSSLAPKLRQIFEELEKQARGDLRREGFPENKQRHERSLAVRYKGQSFELQIKQTSGNIAGAFHRAHRARYGYAQEKNAVEIVSARVRSIGVAGKLKSERRESSASKRTARPREFAETFFERRKIRVAVYRREEVKTGSRLRVPCIVTEYSGTTLIPEATRAEVDDHGNLIIDVG